MSLTRRHFHRLLLTTLVLSPLKLPAEPDTDPVEGRDWALLPTARTGPGPDTIEVVEFFSYGCPHCREFNPMVKAWAQGLPADVQFQRVPVSFGRAAWGNLSRLFYSLETLGELERLDQAIFDAVIKERANLYSEQAIAAWVQEHGVDADRFRQAFGSFEVEVAYTRAEALVRDGGISGVPSLTVDGRYKVLSDNIRSQADLLRIADGLIARARSERSSRQE